MTPHPTEPPGGLRASLLASIPMWLYGIVLLALASLHAFDAAEKFAVDLEAKLVRGDFETTAIVRITESDYRTLFGARSPLDAATLGRLIERIAAGGPAIVAIDIDTSDPSFATLRDLRCDCRLVWARDARPGRDGVVTPLGVLGGVAADAPAATSALVVLLEDAGDKLTRRYARTMRTDDGGTVETMPWTVARLRDPKVAARAADVAPRTIRYVDADRFEIPAGVVMGEGFEWRDRIRGRIVLLGGAYDRDKHFTPLGLVDGVDVIANAIETELRGGGSGRPHWIGILLIGAAAAIAFAAVFHRFRWWVAALVCIGAVLVVTPVFALAGALVYVPYVLAVLLGIVLHEFKRFIRVDSHFVVERAAGAALGIVGARAPGPHAPGGNASGDASTSASPAPPTARSTEAAAASVSPARPTKRRRRRRRGG